MVVRYFCTFCAKPLVVLLLILFFIHFQTCGIRDYYCCFFELLSIHDSHPIPIWTPWLCSGLALYSLRPFLGISFVCLFTFIWGILYLVQVHKVFPSRDSMILSWLSRYIGPVSYSLGLLNTRILLMFVCCSLFFLICYLCNDHDLPRFQMIFLILGMGTRWVQVCLLGCIIIKLASRRKSCLQPTFQIYTGFRFSVFE